MIRKLSCALATVLVLCLVAATAPAAELLADPGFEDTRPLLPEDPLLSDPWRLTFFTPAPVVTNAVIDPNGGLEHASLFKNHALPNADPQIDTAVFAGFGAAATVSDFTGKELYLSVDYNVVQNSVLDAGGTIPGTFIRMHLAYYGASGFLGYGPSASGGLFEAGTTPDYLLYDLTETVPNFGQPVTIVAYNLSVLGQFGGSGTATVYFDNASLTIIPEPATASMLMLALSSLLLIHRRRMCKEVR